MQWRYAQTQISVVLPSTELVAAKKVPGVFSEDRSFTHITPNTSPELLIPRWCLLPGGPGLPQGPTLRLLCSPSF